MQEYAFFYRQLPCLHCKNLISRILVLQYLNWNFLQSILEIECLLYAWAAQIFLMCIFPIILDHIVQWIFVKWVFFIYVHRLSYFNAFFDVISFKIMFKYLIYFKFQSPNILSFVYDLHFHFSIIYIYIYIISLSIYTYICDALRLI